MHKIWVVLKSEFLRRVKSKGFVITTLLGPVLMIGFFAVIIFVVASTVDSDTRTVAVIDHTGVMLERMLSQEDTRHTLVAVDALEDSVRSAVLVGTYDGYLVIPQDLLTANVKPSYYSPEGGGEGLGDWLEDRLERAVQAHRLREHNVDADVLALLTANVNINRVRLTETGDEAGDTRFFTGLGFIMGFLIYMVMLIYGSIVMQGVIEEKTSRVVEVIISSVRPFHLLMGKVLGIGAMSLVQMVVWGGLIVGGTVAIGPLIAMFMDPSKFNLSENASTEQLMEAADIAIPTLSFDAVAGLFVWFILFFLLGYLLYASLFAAVGSAVEQQQDAQGFMLPLMMPIIMAIIFIQPVLESPDSMLATVLSLIPFTSPILMVVRMMVTDVPFWEMALSFLLLVGGFVGSIWISSRIYRVGILMYGKKASIKDLVRWIRYA